MGTEQNYQLSISNLINIQRSQVPHLYSTFLTPRILVYVPVFTVVTVHIVIFWVVTVCSPEGGNNVSVKHVASVFRAEAGRLRMPLCYTGCPRRNLPDFRRVFLMLKYTDITQNTYVQS